MLVTVHNAKTHLSKLIERAVDGEEIVIARGKTPMVKLVPVEKKTFKLGILEHDLTESVPDFLEPLSEEELNHWEHNP